MTHTITSTTPPETTPGTPTAFWTATHSRGIVHDAALGILKAHNNDFASATAYVTGSASPPPTSTKAEYHEEPEDLEGIAEA